MESRNSSLRGIFYLLIILCVTTTANAASPLITFLEFDIGTYITDQYSDLGIIFGGDDPYIGNDGDNPTSPVLKTADFQGDIEVYFVNPNDDVTPATLSWFSMDAGYFNQPQSTTLEWFDINGNKLGEVSNSIFGIETFFIEDMGIASWHIGVTTSEPDGYAIDNLDFGIFSLLDFMKTDDVSVDDCRCPGGEEEFTYTIRWENTSDVTFEDAYIIDYLPEGVSYNYIISFVPYVTDLNYSVENHTYTWQLEDIALDDFGEVELTVTVTEKAEPGMYVHNIAELRDGFDMLVAIDFEDTPVCCWDVDDPNIIYVDMSATGNNTGVDWENAYSGQEGLQRALIRARNSTCDVGLYVVYVAQGTYTSGDYADDTFEVPEGTKVYGGFMAGGSDESGRAPEIYETVLTGYTSFDGDPNVTANYEFNNTVVTMADDLAMDETTVLDGFTITDAVEYGIYGRDVDFDIINCTVTDSGEYGIYGEGADITIENCTVTDSGLQGIYAVDGNVTIKWSKIKNNVEDGIYHTGEGNTITIENSQIINNKQRGIFSFTSTLTIKNTVIFANGYDGSFDGVNIQLPTEVPVLYNNTIVYNAGGGIVLVDDTNIDGDPNLPDYPDLQNCILYYNNTDGDIVGDQITITLPQMPSGYARDDYAVYCDIQGYAEINNNHIINDVPEFIITLDPNSPEANADPYQYYDVNPYHYHLAYDSECKDKGNPIHDTDDVGLYDIDGEDRIADTFVDIGADEINSCDAGNYGDLFNDLDWNVDGIVDGYEIGAFADAWLAHDPNEPGYDPSDPEEYAIWSKARRCNFNGGYYIDYGDFAIFAQDWLWRTCWKMLPVETTQASQQSMMMPMSMGFASLTEEPAPAPVERTTAETVAFVEGIYDVIKYLDASIEEGHENAENLYEIKTFLEGVLLDLQAER